MASAKKEPAKAAEQKGASGKTDALAKLKTDHAAVRKLFDQYEKSKDEMDDEEKEQIVGEICMELTIHAQIEEELFYPAVREVADDDLNELLDEAEVEHAGVEDLVAQLSDASPGDDLYDAKVTVLGEQVKHHAGEEENEMFPKVRKTDLDLSGLGEQLVTRAEELKGEYATAEET